MLTPHRKFLQLKGYSTTYEDFEWQGDSVANTYGAVNTNQVFIFDKELPSVTTVSIESGIANIEFSDAISGIASISVKVLTGATLTLMACRLIKMMFTIQRHRKIPSMQF
ncbi:MAG: hypothetical protein H6629_04020 [Calditrichae bacterium]|nr:hypothetical protein [Calditrichia bacterium]